MPSILRTRAAFTLVEALIAVTMTLVIMLALAQGFKQMSNDISEGRARLSLSDQLRGVSELLRNDLAGLTVVTDPNSKEVKNGYFMYYEGPLADHHPVTCPVNNKLAVVDGGTIEENLSASRFGDFDDILMFTAQAKGDWFRGRVPLAIVKGAGGPYTPSVADWINTVVVASEYAEIAWFMMPEVQPTPSGVASPDFLIQTNADLSLPHYDNDTPVNPNEVVPPFSANPTTGNFIPDRMRLCRRVLLILPSLNTSTGTLFNTLAGAEGADVRLQCAPINNSDAMHIGMRHAYQRCDLSVHRAAAPVGGAAPIVANSLSDLANPANRFAHVLVPGNAIGAGANDASMPILSLTGPLPIQCFATAGNVNYPINYAAIVSPNRGDQNYIEVGFMNPAFLKRRIDPDPLNLGIIQIEDSDALGGTVEVLSNEEVVANNCIAFDLKGFDSSARLLYHVGADGQPGVSGVDDDGNTVTDDAIEFGTAGSDDLEVSPADPGYAETIRGMGATPTLAVVAQRTSRQGTFADIGWAFKRWQPPSVTPPTNPSAYLAQINVGAVSPFIRESALSGVETGGTNPTESLLKSGAVARNPAGVLLIYQPKFDSYTDAFEKDGFRQLDLANAGDVTVASSPANRGTIFNDAANWLAGNVSTNAVYADYVHDGLDNDGNGLIDDYAERDSSPPILSAMPAIQALIRVEDVTAGVIQQLAVTHDLTQ